MLVGMIELMGVRGGASVLEYHMPYPDGVYSWPEDMSNRIGQFFDTGLAMGNVEFNAYAKLGALTSLALVYSSARSPENVSLKTPWDMSELENFLKDVNEIGTSMKIPCVVHPIISQNDQNSPVFLGFACYKYDSDNPLAEGTLLEEFPKLSCEVQWCFDDDQAKIVDSVLFWTDLNAQYAIWRAQCAEDSDSVLRSETFFHELPTLGRSFSKWFWPTVCGVCCVGTAASAYAWKHAKDDSSKTSYKRLTVGCGIALACSTVPLWLSM
jgi:hypothetical protein